MVRKNKKNEVFIVLDWIYCRVVVMIFEIRILSKYWILEV